MADNFPRTLPYNPLEKGDIRLLSREAKAHQIFKLLDVSGNDLRVLRAKVSAKRLTEEDAWFWA